MRSCGQQQARGCRGARPAPRALTLRDDGQCGKTLEQKGNIQGLVRTSIMTVASCGRDARRAVEVRSGFARGK